MSHGNIHDIYNKVLQFVPREYRRDQLYIALTVDGVAAGREEKRKRGRKVIVRLSKRANTDQSERVSE